MMMMMIFMVCGATATSEHNHWRKLQRSNPLSSISLIFGVHQRIIGDEEGTSNAIDLAKDWLLEKGVNASEIVAVEESFIEVNVPIGVAEALVGAIYYDYQSEKDGNTIIQRINDEDEFVIPQSAAHFLDFVYPTVLYEEEFVVDGGELSGTATGGRSLLQFEFSSCSKYVYATSEENCGTIQVPDREPCHWGGSLCCWDGTGCYKTIPATCGFSVYSDGCQWCRTTNVWIGTTAECLGNTKHQRLTSCESGTFHDTVSKQIPETFKRRIFVGCWKDSSDRAMWKYIGEGYDHESCYKACVEFPFQYFAIQNEDQCFCSSDDSTTTGLRKYGQTTNCRVIDQEKRLVVGGAWSNAVYTVPSCFPRYDSCDDIVQTCMDYFGA